MGYYRFLLAISVVYFHVGGATWVIGRVAVMGFYVISGYLIFRVLDRRYSLAPGGVGRFYLNRLLRLVPLYVVISLATYVWVRAHGGSGIRFEGSELAYVSNAPLEHGFFDMLWGDLKPRTTTSDGVEVLTFSPDMIPQGWSIGIEFCFYLMAPLGLLLYRLNRLAGLSLFAGSVAYFLYALTRDTSFGFFDNSIYKNALTTAFLFLFGGSLYVLSNRWQRRAPFWAACVTMLLLAWWILAWSVPNVSVYLSEPRVWLLLIGFGVVMLVSAIVIFSQPPTGKIARVDGFLGDLSYGIYLNHLLVATWMVGFNAKAEDWVGAPWNAVFGRPNTLQFGVNAIVLSSVLSTVTFFAVERPLQRVRRSVRPHADPALPVAWPATLGARALAAARAIRIRDRG